MAPDLNTVPVSPHPGPANTSNPSTSQPASGSLSRQTSATVSRRASQMAMSPPPLPLASPGGTLPPPAHSASQHGHSFPPLSPSASGYVQASVDSAGVPMRHPRPMTPAEMHLELEKEQEAVVNPSNATADSSVAHAEASTGPMHPTSSRRHRSSSSVSRSGLPPGYIPHRYSISSQPATGDPNQRDHRSSSVVSTPRYEEVAQHKAELEEVKKENEALKQRIRDLERQIRGNNDADGQRGRRGAPQSQSSGVGNASDNTQVPANATAVPEESSR
ncbi:unnamed protein product [Alternaria alternata]